MKKYEILLVVVVIMILSVGTASAWDWDNLKTYDSKEQEVTITNAFGLGETLMKAQLKTNPIVFVIPGKDRQVAEIELTTLNRDYGFENAFQDMKFYNNYNNREINRDFKYKLRNTVSQTPVFETTCETKGFNINGSAIRVCTSEIVDYHYQYSWKEIKSFDDIPLGTVTIGIFTDVQTTDYVEWIPNYYGRNVNEWAAWTSGYNNNLTAYWKFNNTLSNGGCCNFTVDSLGTLNMTLNTSVQQTGLFGNATLANTEGSGSAGINLQNYGAGAEGFTINWWMNVTDNAAYGNGANYLCLNADDGRTAGIPNGGFNVQSINGATPKIYIEYDIGGDGVFAEYTITNETWQMITIRGNGTTLDLWINGTKKETKAFAAINWANEVLRILGDSANAGNNMEGMLIDEMGFWNRSLSALELNGLYNNGTGMTYDDLGIFAAIQNPTNVTYNSTFVNLTYITDADSRCVYSKDNYATNSSYVNAGVNWTNQNTTTGTQLWNLWCNSSSATATDEVRFHIKAPELNSQVNYPPDNYASFRSNMNFSANFSAFGSLTLTNATMYLWYSSNGTLAGTNSSNIAA